MDWILWIIPPFPIKHHIDDDEDDEDDEDDDDDDSLEVWSNVRVGGNTLYVVLKTSWKHPYLISILLHSWFHQFPSSVQLIGPAAGSFFRLICWCLWCSLSPGTTMDHWDQTENCQENCLGNDGRFFHHSGATNGEPVTNVTNHIIWK